MGSGYVAEFVRGTISQCKLLEKENLCFSLIVVIFEPPMVLKVAPFILVAIDAVTLKILKKTRKLLVSLAKTLPIGS